MMNTIETYEAIFNASPDSMLIFDLEGEIQLANSQTEKLFQYKKTDLIGSKIQHLFIEESHDKLSSMIKSCVDVVLSDQNNQSLELWALKNDTSTCAVEMTYTSIQSNSKPIFVACLRDITEKLALNKKLNEDISNHSTIFENSVDDIWLIDKDYRIILINKVFQNSFFTAFGIQLEKGMVILENVLDPNTRALWKSRYDEVFKNKKLLHIEDRIDLGFTVVYYELYMYPILEHDQITGISIFGRDITARKTVEEALKHSEEKYRTIFENIQDVFIQTNQDGIISEISPSINYISGFKREDLIGTPVQELYFNKADRELFLEEINKKGEVRDFELKFKTDTKESLFVSLSAHLIYDSEGKPYHIEGLIRDISDRKKNEIEIEKQNRKLISQNSELEQFTFIASHDLQEPLRTLISFSSLIKEECKGKINEQTDIYLDFIEKSSTRMQKLVKGLLDYSRIGKEQNLSSVDLNSIVADVQNDLALIINEKNATILTSKLPSIHGYEVELRQLFQNLLSNALKFSKKDMPCKITISAAVSEKQVTISVADNGIGIEEKHFDKIFILFKRLHNRNDYEGTGIGLAHCKKIVDLHGGSISVESTLGVGSIFKFTIPTE